MVMAKLESVIEVHLIACCFQEQTTHIWVLVVVHGCFVVDNYCDNGHSCHKKNIWVTHLLIFLDRFACLVYAVQDH